MHPDICRVVSAGVYESRLHSSPETINQLIDCGEPPTLPKKSGYLWVPVTHTGNSQASEEEVDAIEGIVKELSGCSYTDSKGVVRLLEPEKDILIVAPYNMQVRLIARRIPKVQVASVDKFQGREAPVVILSMCSSEASGSPRGIDFLFSKNRLNVAISRAQSMTFIVANPILLKTSCSSLKQMTLLNFFCQIVAAGN
jgi:uncharacterized protein